METGTYAIKNANVFLTYRQKFEPRTIVVRDGRIAAVLDPDADAAINSIDAQGMYVIPGMTDVHMHIESSMTHPKEFSRWALRYGTTGIVADAHEIVNVFGMDGQFAFMNQETDLDILWAIPSSVPATNPSLETSGAEMTVEDVKRMLADPRVVSLGEVMNMKDLLSEEPTKIQEFIRACKEIRGRDIRIEGHCPKISGADLNAFIAAGVDADHTLQTPASILEKCDLGMFLEIQYKSVTPDTVRTIVENNLYENVALVTDDVVPDKLAQGQLNTVVRYAVECGMPLEKAIYCATFTGARRMHLDERGMIAPGKVADLVFYRDISTLVPDVVIKSGRKVFDAAEGVMPKAEKVEFPEHFYHSVKCRMAKDSDFILHTKDPAAKKVIVNAISVNADNTATQKVERELAVQDGVIQWEDSDLSLVTIFERYGKNGNVAYGFLEHAFAKKGAAATTWSHDSHNLIVVGRDGRDMAAAQNRVVEEQGAYVVAIDGKVAADAPLTIAGIVSSEPMEELGKQIGEVRQAMESLGWHNSNVLMSMSTLALPVSPALKMTDYGYLDTRTQEAVPLIVREIMQ